MSFGNHCVSATSHSSSTHSVYYITSRVSSSRHYLILLHMILDLSIPLTPANAFNNASFCVLSSSFFFIYTLYIFFFFFLNDPPPPEISPFPLPAPLPI